MRKGSKALDFQGLSKSIPRTRGGDPLVDVDHRDRAVLFPAPAGVIPGVATTGCAVGTIPRTRGGDPCTMLMDAICAAYSPHPRG